MRSKRRMLGKKPAKWRNVLFIDPGIRSMGFAFWGKIERRLGKFSPSMPDDSGVVNHSLSDSWLKAILDGQSVWLQSYIEVQEVKHLVLEFTEVWLEDETSIAAAAKGDLAKLTMLIGSLGRTFHMLTGRHPEVWKPSEWKGNMPKPVMKNRVRRAYKPRKVKFREHEFDTIAMGLRVMGKL